MLCAKQCTHCAMCGSQQHSPLPYCCCPVPIGQSPLAACLYVRHSHTHQIAEEALLGAAARLERLERPEGLLHGDGSCVLLSTPRRPHACAHRWAQSTSGSVLASQRAMFRVHGRFIKDCLQQHIAYTSCMPAGGDHGRHRA